MLGICLLGAINTVFIQYNLALESNATTDRGDSLKPVELTEIRRKAHVGQRDLATALGIPPQRLSDMERGYMSIPCGFDKRVRVTLERILHERLAMVRSN